MEAHLEFVFTRSLMKLFNIIRYYPGMLRNVQLKKCERVDH